ncbi:MAG: NAD(P)/FAD-dependent oxidoreductase [Hyphomicrobium sp.]
MSSAYIKSYYTASISPPTPYPRLEGTVQADVAVIGGGFSGIATALTMAERGYSVALVEAHRIGWGASGRNGGQMIAGISGEARLAGQLGAAGKRLLRDIRYRGHDIITERIAKYDIDCDFKPGWMEVAARPRHWDALRAHVDDMAAEGHGAHYELVAPKDVPRVIASSAYHGGYIDRRSGHLHPLKLCLGEARAAAALGVRIFENSPAVTLQGGPKPYVATEHGRINASTIVLAGNTDHPFQRGRLNGLLFPTGSYIIATEPLGDDLARTLNPQDLAVADSNIVLDYYRLSADKRMLFGGRCNYSNRDPKNLAENLQPRLAQIFPQLAGKRIDYAWGGRIGIVLTRIPAIGRLEPNVYYMQGYCGHGVNTTHIAADIVSDAICGTTEKLDLFDRIQHIRLPVGGWAGNQMLALGMLYYRLRDLM